MPSGSRLQVLGLKQADLQTGGLRRAQVWEGETGPESLWAWRRGHGRCVREHPLGFPRRTVQSAIELMSGGAPGVEGAREAQVGTAPGGGWGGVGEAEGACA